VVSAPDIPGHRVAGVLGKGGFATVYRCWQLAVGREVAVKVDNRVLLSERDRRRFVREVTAAGRLSGHPHVIDVFDAGTLDDGRPYLVMELCPAGSLNDALRRDGPMAPARVCDIGIRIADALAAAHAAGVLHRDIKPANILINRYGMVGLADFGLASIVAAEGEQSATREALTPAYASPESFQCDEPTVAADIYSLAATLYALLAGRPPRFPAGEKSPSLATIMRLHAEPIGDVPGTPPELMALLRRSLATDPTERPASAAALRDALAALGAPPGGPRRASPPWNLDPHRNLDPDRPSNPSRNLDPHRNLGPHPESGQAGTTAPPGRRRRPVTVPVALAAGLVMTIAVAAILGARLLPHGSGTGTSAGTVSTPSLRAGPAAAAAPGVFGVPTVTSGCPAASVRAAAARCPAAPECWDGLVVISGDASAGRLPCTGRHIWETFAIAILPSDVRTFDQNIVQANRAVRAVCSTPVLLASRRGQARQIPASGWDIEVLPPDEAAFNSGARAYRCVAHSLSRTDPTTSQFGR
jgi:serine/threonine protein kinase